MKCRHTNTHSYVGFLTCKNCGDLVGEPQKKDSRRNSKVRNHIPRVYIKK